MVMAEMGACISDSMTWAAANCFGGGGGGGGGGGYVGFDWLFLKSPHSCPVFIDGFCFALPGGPSTASV